jgi:hypothetical protein
MFRSVVAQSRIEKESNRNVYVYAIVTCATRAVVGRGAAAAVVAVIEVVGLVLVVVVMVV